MNRLSLNKSKKHLIVLPSNFQELVILKEMKFNSGDRGIELIRELLYLYSLGMEYYDSVNNPMIYSHYSSRNINMLINPEVTAVLDKFGGRKSKDLPSIEILNDTPYKTISNKTFNLDVYRKNTLLSHRESIDLGRLSQLGFNPLLTTHNFRDERESVISVDSRQRAQSTKKENKRHLIDECRKGVQSEIKSLEEKMNNIENLIDKNLDLQYDSFIERKKRKKDKLRAKQRKSMRYMVRKGSKLDEILIAVVNRGSSNSERIDENDILKGIMELSEKKAKSMQTFMIREIDEFVEKNMIEMQKGLDELRISFEDEIKCVDEEVFPDVYKGLKEDMDAELENLKDQYEEQRREGVEKIKSKYSKKH